jgi:hypothetical protein
MAKVKIELEGVDNTGKAFEAARGRMQSLQLTQEQIAYRNEARENALNTRRSKAPALSRLLRGDVTALDELSIGWGKVGSMIGKAALVTGVAVAAWKAGLAIQSALWKRFVGDLNAGAKEASASFGQLGAALKLAFVGKAQAAVAEIKRINAAAQEAIAAADFARGQQGRRGRAAVALAAPAPVAGESELDKARRETEAASEAAQADLYAAEREQQDAANALVTLEKRKADVQRELAKAQRAADEAMAKAQGFAAQGGDGEKMRAGREAAQEAARVTKEAADAERENLKKVNAEIEEQKTKRVEGAAAQKKAEDGIAQAGIDFEERRKDIEDRAAADAKRAAEEAENAAKRMLDIQQKIADEKARGERDAAKAAAQADVAAGEKKVADLAVPRRERMRAETDERLEKERADRREQDAKRWAGIMEGTAPTSRRRRLTAFEEDEAKRFIAQRDLAADQKRLKDIEAAEQKDREEMTKRAFDEMKREFQEHNQRLDVLLQAGGG